MAARVGTFREEILTNTENCPIGLEQIVNPVKVTCCNKFFEKENLKKWVRTHHNCPCCRATLSMPNEGQGRSRPFTYRRIVNPPLPRLLPRLQPRPLARPVRIENPSNPTISLIVSLAKYFLLGAVSMFFLNIKISGIIAYPVSAIVIGWINWQIINLAIVGITLVAVGLGIYGASRAIGRRC